MTTFDVLGLASGRRNLAKRQHAARRGRYRTAGIEFESLRHTALGRSGQPPMPDRGKAGLEARLRTGCAALRDERPGTVRGKRTGPLAGTASLSSELPPGSRHHRYLA